MDDGTKIAFGIIGSGIITVFAFSLNWISAYFRRNTENKERLTNELFVLSEKMLRYSIHANQRALNAEYHLALYEKDKNEHDRSSHLMYLKDLESACLLVIEASVSLCEKLNDLDKYWDDDIHQLRQIKKHLTADGADLIKSYRGIFDLCQASFEFDAIYDVNMARVQTYVYYESSGLHLLKLQKEICPNINIPRPPDINTVIAK